MRIFRIVALCFHVSFKGLSYADHERPLTPIVFEKTFFFFFCACGLGFTSPPTNHLARHRFFRAGLLSSFFFFLQKEFILLKKGCCLPCHLTHICVESQTRLLGARFLWLLREELAENCISYRRIMGNRSDSRLASTARASSAFFFFVLLSVSSQKKLSFSRGR